MISKAFSSLNTSIKISSTCVLRRYSTSITNQGDSEKVDITTADEKPLFDDPKYNEEEIMQKRLKSRLNTSHRNILLNKIPYTQEMAVFHTTTKYKKRMLGRYGLNSLNVPPGICWPSKEAIESLIEYENVARPWTLQECWEKLAQKRKEEKEKILARDREIERNMQKAEKWQKEMEEKIAKKEAEALQAKKRRERLLQEVRDHFGFRIDTKDDRFKQMLEQKEEEEKKAKKAAKKTEKMNAYLEKLQKSNENIADDKKTAKDSKTNETKIKEKS